MPGSLPVRSPPLHPQTPETGGSTENKRHTAKSPEGLYPADANLTGQQGMRPLSSFVTLRN
jgi:hypothetical protein